MKLEKTKVSSKKLYSIGYSSKLNKFILCCVVPGSAWYDRFYEISEEMFNSFDFSTDELDKFVDDIRKSNYESDKFLCSEMVNENTQEQLKLLHLLRSE